MRSDGVVEGVSSRYPHGEESASYCPPIPASNTSNTTRPQRRRGGTGLEGCDGEGSVITGRG